MLADQVVIPGGMIGHPIEDDVHPLFMSGSDEMFEIIQAAKPGIDAVIIFNGVGAAQAAFAILSTNLVNGHEPQNVHAQLF